MDNSIKEEVIKEENFDLIEVDPLSSLVVKVEVQEAAAAPPRSEEDSLQCPKCQVVYPKPASLKNHIQVCKVGPFNKPLTKKQVEMSEEIQNEVKRSIQILERSCFSELDDMELLQDQEEGLNECHFCKDCNQMFFSIKTFACHVYAHTFIRKDTSDLPHICADCGSDFESLPYAESHRTKSSKCKNLPKQLFSCDICERLFTRKDNLRHHLQEHANFKKVKTTYDCRVCKRSFGGQSVLNIHMRSHAKSSSTYNHACDICRKVFTGSASLKKHKNIHQRATNKNDDTSSSSSFSSLVNVMSSTPKVQNNNKSVIKKFKHEDDASKYAPKMKQMKTYVRKRFTNVT